MSCLKLAGDGYAVSGAIEIVANGEGQLRCDFVGQIFFCGAFTNGFWRSI